MYTLQYFPILRVTGKFATLSKRSTNSQICLFLVDNGTGLPSFYGHFNCLQL